MSVFAFVGHQPMQCTYTPSLEPAPPQYYDGAINTLGIDVGVSAGSVLAWGVFAPTTGLPQGALSGEYVGASGDVGFVVGGGANCLWAAPAVPSLCNRSRCKARSRSMSCWTSRHSNCVRQRGDDPMRAPFVASAAAAALLLTIGPTRAQAIPDLNLDPVCRGIAQGK